ncbi:MAG: hypothetical protein ACOCRX_06365 [Candidatus Woesearchaeota archaeon]
MPDQDYYEENIRNAEDALLIIIGMSLISEQYNSKEKLQELVKQIMKTARIGVNVSSEVE